MIKDVGAIGWVANFFSIINLLPQVIQAYVTGSVVGVSPLTMLAFFIGDIFWIIYGIGINSFPVIVSSVVQFVAAFILLWFKYGTHVKGWFNFMRPQPLVAIQA